MTTHLYGDYGYGPQETQYPSISGFGSYEEMLSAARQWLLKRAADSFLTPDFRVKVYVPGSNYEEAFAGYVTAYRKADGSVTTT